MQFKPQDFTTSEQVLALYNSWTPEQRIRYANALYDGDHSTADGMDKGLTGGIKARNMKKADLCYIINYFDRKK